MTTEVNQPQRRWTAYLSSALTIADERKRLQIAALNADVKTWLEEPTDTFVYLPQDYSAPYCGVQMPPEEIYILDRWRIAEADFVLMNLDVPAFGVGQEAEIATSLGVPIVAFHSKHVLVSRIIRGAPVLFPCDAKGTPSSSVIEYEDVRLASDLKEKLIARVQQLQGHITPLSEHLGRERPFSARLKARLTKEGVTVEELAAGTKLSTAFLRILLQDFNSVESLLSPRGVFRLRPMAKIPEDRYVNPGLWVLKRLAEFFKIRVGELLGENVLHRDYRKPLDVLASEGTSLAEFLGIVESTQYDLSYREAARTDPESVIADLRSKVLTFRTTRAPSQG